MKRPHETPPSALFSSTLLCALLLAASGAFVSCGDPSPELEKAQRFVVRGELQRAHASLIGLESGQALQLRTEIGAEIERRQALRQELASLGDGDPLQAQRELAAMLKRESDPWTVQQIEFELSSAVDRAADYGSRASLEQRRQEQKLAERKALEAVQRASEEMVVPVVGSLPLPDELGSEEVPTREPESEAVAEPGDVAQAQPEVEEPGPAPEQETASVEPEPELEAKGPTRLEIMGPEFDAAERGLIRARSSKRDAAYEVLADHGQIAEQYMWRALEARFERAFTSAIKHKSVRSLEKLAQDRVQLDFRRQEALALIFDKEEYFYPYRPPGCPPAKARLYGAVQKRVDDLVADLREAWSAPRTVKLPDSFHDLFEEMRWCRERADENDLELEYPADLPVWLFTISPGMESMELAGFAWDQKERDAFRRDTLVRQRNELLWSKKGLQQFSQEEQPAGEEQEQVRVTNDYRRLFGRQALAWNPKLQASASGHSDYMANTGNFGHHEEDRPKRRTPFDRMALVGYKRGVSENCSMGSASAQVVQDRWARSSGHHRNLLIPGHTELGSGVNSIFWTQNFGNDKAFEDELEQWQD